MTHTEDPRIEPLLRIARAAREVADLAFVFNIRGEPQQCLGGLTPERADAIRRDFREALQAQVDAFCGVNLDDPRTLRYADDARQEAMADAMAADGDAGEPTEPPF